MYPHDRKPGPGYELTTTGYKSPREEISSISDKGEATLKPKPTRAVSSLQRIGWYPITLLLLSLLGVLAFIGYISFLWFTADENARWRRIALAGWLNKSIALASVILRTAVAVQAGIASSMLAAILLEGPGIRLPELAAISAMRASSAPPHYLFGHLIPETMRAEHRPRRKWALLFVCALLSVTTLTLQFTSTILLTDVDIALITGHTSTSNYTVEDTEVLTDYNNKWGTGVRAYPTFAEYADPTTIDRRNGVADTGLTLRSFLPVTLAQTRSALLRYEGPATIIDSRVTCVRPNITNFQVSYDDLQFLRLPRFSGNISIPTDLTSSRLYANNSMTFTCSMSLGVANATLNYRSSDWNMTLCQIYVSPGFLLPEFFTPEAYWQRRNDSDFEPYSTDGSMTYLAMNYTGPNYNNNDTFDTFQEIFNGSSPGLVYQNHGEWLQVYRDNGTLKADSGMLSFSLCFPSFLTTKQNIVAYSPTNRSEPRFLYDSNSQRFLFSDIRNQHLSSSGRSAAERGILSLEKQEWRASSLEDIDYLDDLDIYHMTNFPWVDTNESATIQLTNYTSGTGFTSRADLSISGPAHEILQSGGSIAEAVQSVLTTLVQSRYLGLMFVASPDGILFNQTELVNAQVPGGGAGIVVHKVAGPTRSYLIIMICVAIHSAVVSVVIVWFCRETSVTSLWNSWQTVAQILSPKVTPFLDQATTATDLEVERWMRDVGMSNMSVAVGHNRRFEKADIQVVKRRGAGGMPLL